MIHGSENLACAPTQDANIAFVMMNTEIFKDSFDVIEAALSIFYRQPRKVMMVARLYVSSLNTDIHKEDWEIFEQLIELCEMNESNIMMLVTSVED